MSTMKNYAVLESYTAVSMERSESNTHSQTETQPLICLSELRAKSLHRHFNLSFNLLKFFAPDISHHQPALFAVWAITPSSQCECLCLKFTHPCLQHLITRAAPCQPPPPPTPHPHPSPHYTLAGRGGERCTEAYLLRDTARIKRWASGGKFTVNDCRSIFDRLHSK